MTIRKSIYVLAVALMAGLTACSVDNPQDGLGANEDKTPQMSPDVVDGQLLVRFDARVSDILDKAGLTKSGPAMPMKRSGVLSVDEILSLVDGYQIERVFPVDLRSEAKAREEGLHLWYVVRFGKEHSVEKVAADLSRLGEVSRVEYNYNVLNVWAVSLDVLTEFLSDFAVTCEEVLTSHTSLTWSTA